MALAGPSRLSPTHSFLPVVGSPSTVAAYHVHDDINVVRSLDDGVNKGKGKHLECEVEDTEYLIVDLSNGHALDTHQEEDGEDDLGILWLFDERDSIMTHHPEEEQEPSRDAMARITGTLERRAQEIEQRPLEVEPTR
jgi:hypothetical protein